MSIETKIRVLLVEDEPALSMIIKDTLEKRDFCVDCAPNGEQGLQVFFKLKPDIVVADIMMPKMDGFSMTQLIRQSDKHTPILFLSAKSKTEDVVQGFETGGNDYLKKPFGMEELIIRIKSLLNRVQSEEPKQTIYRIGEYTFDSLQQKLTYRTHSETLSHREAGILERLCINQNNILENKSVLLDLWGDDSFFNTRSLHVFIVKIRKKLSHDSNVEIINIRGIGYKMILK
ncbi:DNA-binding response OmpR family regulator [Dysgonomonas alginatilytica]|uniref:DNA-binding response OmpR family regulator n=1 Tax=Dysgonomonas alginatilytica TaxID=1605892 RepID=A0A2V3PR04_9BACT|nr:response regulator transcription factor [Dysgonomonas alginatilytica]PXV65921.1 DNA-binding response OmpR family regulator [Dysgonomonas alginatilytica]